MTDGPLADSTLLTPGRQVVPAGHAPRLVEHAGAGQGVTIHEPGTDGAWMTAENALPRCLWE